MNQKILIANEAVTLANHFILCMFFFLAAQVLILGAPCPWYFQMIFFIYLGIIIAIRLFITNTFFIYIGLHFILFGTVLLFPLNNLMLIECIIYLTILTVQSIDFWKRNGYKQNTSLPWPSTLAMLCFYIYAIVTEQDMLCSITYILGTVYLLLFLARLYLTGLYELSNSKTNVSRLPLTQIVKTNSILIGLILAIITVTILLANICNLDDTVFTIIKGLGNIIKYVSAGIYLLITWLGRLILKANPDSTLSSDIDEVFVDMQQENSLLSIIFEVLFMAFQCIIFGLIIFWIFRGMYRIAKLFLKQTVSSGDQVEGIHSKQDDKDFLTEHIKEETPALIKGRIRRRYRREILKHKKDIVLTSSMTTSEIEEQLSAKDRRKMHTLKCEYEETRYFHEDSCSQSTTKS